MEGAQKVLKTDPTKVVAESDALDTRGSGGSTRPEDREQMSTAAMANDIDRLRSYLGLDSINLLGHSNGSAIALDYAERYPQRRRRLF
jgi:proline iminopeptidase